MNDSEFVEALRGLIAIPSVSGKGAGEAPYGEPCAEALRYVLTLCEGFGFRTKNCAGRVGWAEIGEGEEMVGVLCHLDVVPAGSGWTHDPFGGELSEGNLYGRGVVDDKGPAMAVIFAMRELLEQKTPLDRRIRMVFGLAEETGNWSDMEYYKQTEELPAFGFTPDADFPALYGEKGILHLTVRLPGDGLKSLKGGSAVNMVPDFCEAETASGEKLSAHGRSAHGSKPAEGENAISRLAAALGEKLPDCPFAKFYNETIGMDTTGAGLDCALSDPESGALTLNAGTVLLEDGVVTLKLDLRYPVTVPMEEVLHRAENRAQPFGASVSVLDHQDPVFLNRSGPVIQTLMRVYREETGDDTPPRVIGGGTYARAMKNIVAYGPLLPGREETEHQKDEYLALDDLLKAKEIYRSALQALANG